MTELQKYLTDTAHGGYSNCISGKDLASELWQGSTIPNCVGLAWGLFNFFRGTKKKFKRMQGNAKDLYSKCKKDGSGFWVSREPKDNSIACYNIGDCGHVVYILAMLKDNYAIMVESNYSGTVANGKALRFKFGNPRTLYNNYLGCIYDFT